MKYTQPIFAWKGVMPAITTQFSHSGELYIKGFIKNLNAQVDAGASWIILGGYIRVSKYLNSDRKSPMVLTVSNTLTASEAFRVPSD